MKIKVSVDPTVCIGSASCVAIAPASFQLNDQNISEFVGENDSQDVIQEAAKACPTNAIKIMEVDDSGNEVRQIWPPAE